MSRLEDLLDEARRHVVYEDAADIPNDVYALLEALVGDVLMLMQAAKRASQSAAGMARADALKAAREHVEAISTNTRGYQDGVKLSDKVAAVETFARFLMGESE